MSTPKVILETPALGPLGQLARIGLLVVGAIYVLGVFLVGAGLGQPFKFLPESSHFFVEVAALFPGPQRAVIEYRAEGWSCAEQRWVELDVRPWFPMNADIKENRFHRALKFHQKDRRVLAALERFILERNNGAAGRAGIGGVRLDKIRIANPKLGEKVSPFVHKPLADYPEKARHVLFATRTTVRDARCHGGSVTAPGGESASDEPAAASAEANDARGKNHDDDDSEGL